MEEDGFDQYEEEDIASSVAHRLEGIEIKAETFPARPTMNIMKEMDTKTVRHSLRRLQVLKDVGLDYLPLGQSTSTLSGGEVQRLKLTGQLSGLKQKSRLLLLDEPTIGLHRADIVKLVNCLRRLVDVGYSVVVIEHDLDLVRAADYVIEMGPGAGTDGGRIVAAGTLDDIAADKASVTAKSLESTVGI